MSRILPNPRYARLLCLMAVVCACLTPSTWAQIGQERLYHLFDFEERELGNWEDLPMNWYIVGRPAESPDPNFIKLPLHQELTTRTGFPGHNINIRFDAQQRVSGQQSLYMSLEGGDAGVYLGVGTLPVVPQSDYLISVKVRTTSMRFAAARVVAYFVDEAGRRIESSVVTSPPITTNEQWDQVSLRLPGNTPDAAWLGLELLVLQPSRSTDTALGKHKVNYLEARGAAWFDDVGVWQLPRATLSTQSPTNLIRSPDQPRLNIRVRDLSGKPLIATVKLYDHTGTLAASTQQRMGRGKQPAWSWTPPLHKLGWYMTELHLAEVNDDGSTTPIARNIGALLWLPRDSGASVDDADRFVLGDQVASAEELKILPDVLALTGIRSTVVSIWDQATTLSTLEARQTQLDQLINALALRQHTVTFSLSPVPSEMLHLVDIDSNSPLPMVAMPRERWLPYLAPIMLRQGPAAAAWQLGSTTQPDSIFLPNLGELVEEAKQQIIDHTPSPKIVLPWSMDQIRRKDVRGVDYDLAIPTAIRPESLPRYIREWRAAGRSGTRLPRLSIRTQPADRLTHDRRLTDLVQRMVYAWTIDAPPLTLDRPWSTVSDLHTTLMPDPALGVFSNVASLLSGRRYVGHMPIADGVECLIFDGPPGGMLVAWNNSAPDDEAVIDMTLGGNAIATDLFGNATTLLLRDGRHQLKLSTTPVFITGIDPKLALFRAAFTLTPREIESTQTLHTRTITITNPWPYTMTGTMTITQPESWRISPKQHSFSIPAGKSMNATIQLMFPISEIAGTKKLTAHFDFMVNQRYVVGLTAPMDLGLKHIRSDATLAIEPNAQTGGQDAVVTQLITNTGSEPVSLQAFAQLVGFPRQERLISGLKPGQSVVRRFRFTEAAEEARDKGVRVGLRESGGPAVLNRLLHIEE